MKKSFHPFEPFITKNSAILILGTFPSLKSFEQNFYYAHKQNQFWRLLAATFDKSIPQSIEEKKALLLTHNIALWDIVKSCTRTNSSDANLKSITPNDIAKLLEEFPTIQKICFTSKTAQKIYQKYFKSLQVETYYLPSPSPAYQAMKFEQKLQKYKAILNP